MRYFTQIISFVAVALLSLSACTKVQVEKFNDLENRSLKAWMLKNRPDLVENFQEDGNYYVEILEAGAADSMAIHDVVADKNDVTINKLGNVVKVQGGEANEIMLVSMSGAVVARSLGNELVIDSMPKGMYVAVAIMGDGSRVASKLAL